ncbi:MAG: translocation/assembly module TamB domain-containing protein, partial [Deltaproteobacteria bacterium]|nr:translocation/assembly module TamB domain-containing protein [Deltaproteobacteria bacterium]
DGGRFFLQASGVLAGFAARAEAAALTATLRGEHVNPAALGGPPLARGNVSLLVQGSLEKPAGRPLSQLSASGSAAFSGTAGPMELERGLVRFSARPGALEIQEGLAAWEGGEVAFSGTMDPTGGMDAEARLDISRLATVSGLFVDPPVTGGLAGTVSARGMVHNPLVEADVSLENVAWGDYSAARATLKASGRPAPFSGTASLAAENVSAGMPLSSVRADLTLRDRRLFYDLRATHGGRPLSVAAAGTVDDVTAGVREIAAKTLAVEALGHSWDGGGRFAVGPDKVEAKAFSLTSGGQRLSAAGWYAYTGALDVKASASGVELAAFSGLTGRDLQGAAGFEVWAAGVPAADASVSLDWPAAGGTARVEADAAVSTGGSLFAKGTVPLSLSLSPARFALGASGMDVSADIKDLDLSFLPSMVGPLTETRAVLDASVTARGDPRRPAVSGEISLAGDRVGVKDAPDLTELSADVSFGPDRVEVKTLSARVGSSGAVRASGAFGLEKDPGVTVEIRDLDLLPWTGGFLAGPGVSGSLDATLTLSGTPARPRAAFFAEADNLAHPRKPHLPTADLSLSGSYAAGKAVFSAKLAPSSGGVFTATGSQPLAFSLAPARFSLPSRGLWVSAVGDRLSLNFLPAWIGPLRSLDAYLDLTATLKGDPRSPAFSGRGKLTGRSMELAGRELPIRDILVSLSWDSASRFAVERLFARSGEAGRIAGRGAVELSGGVPKSVDMEVSLRQFTLNTPLASAAVDADVRARGVLPGAVVSGNVRVGEGEFRLEEFLSMRARKVPGLEDVVIVEKEREGGPEPAERLPSVWNAMGLDLAVEVKGPFWIRGAGAQVEITGEVDAVKEQRGRMGVNGSLETVRGYYTFSGRTFEVQKGRIIFTGVRPPDPNLDVWAAYKVSGVTVSLNIHGSASDIRLTLSGDPPMTDTVAMSYLLFGKPPQELTGGQAASLQQQAVGYFGAQVIDELKQRLGHEVPLDILTLEKGTGSEEGAQVVAGKYISPKLFVTYRRGVGPQGENELMLEYYLTDNLTIQSQVGSQESGANVFFTIDY